MRCVCYADCNVNRIQKSAFVFTTERGSSFSTSGFAKLIERAGEMAGLGISGACPYASATPVASPWRTRVWIRARCRPYLGHKNIQHTVRYSELAPGRFKDFWR